MCLCKLIVQLESNVRSINMYIINNTGQMMNSYVYCTPYERKWYRLVCMLVWPIYMIYGLIYMNRTSSKLTRLLQLT